MKEFGDLLFNASDFANAKSRLSDYFGYWSIESTRFQQLWSIAQGMNLSGHVESSLASGHKVTEVHSEYETTTSSTIDSSSIAVIHLSGTLTKAGCSIDGSSSMVAVRHQIRNATRDTAISGILLVVDSPGGTVAGTEDLSDEVYKARQEKPVYAVIEDLGASAAYWVASQSTKVFAANKTTLVGSIGTFMAIYDMSKNFDKEGVKAIVVKAGEFKGAGTLGTEVTDAQVNEHQKIVDGLQDQFTAHVQRGRGFSLDYTKSLVTGLVYTAEQALSMKLVDGIQSIEDTLQQLQLASREANNPEGDSMSQTTGKAASYNEIVAACPSIKPSAAEDSQFIVSCQQRGLAASEANKEWCATLAARVDTARAELDETEEELEQSRKSRKSRKSNTDEEQQQSRKSKRSRAQEEEELAEDEEEAPTSRKSRKSRASDEEQQQSRRSKRSRAQEDEELAEDDQTDDFTSEDEEELEAEDEEQPASRYRSQRGVRTIGTRSRRSGNHASASAAFNAQVDRVLARHPKMSRPDATRKVNAEHPDLREAMVEEANSRRKRR